MTKDRSPEADFGKGERTKIKADGNLGPGAYDIPPKSKGPSATIKGRPKD